MFWYGDLSFYFVPLLHFQRAELLTGHVPLWNPWILCGTPFFGNPQAWPLYPSSGLLSVLSAERAGGIVGALHCLWAMLGTALFLRRRGIGEWGAALGALAFGLGGALVSKCQFPNMVQAGSWLPWLMWAIEGVVRDYPLTPNNGGAARVRLPIIGAGGNLTLCIGLAALSAHPQMTWMQAILCLAWVAFRKPNRATLGRLALAAVLGGLLAAGQLLPVLCAAMDSVRPRLSLGEASRFFLPIYMLPTVFCAPNFYGNPFVAPPYIGRGNFWEPCAYAGLLPLALAGLALRTLKRVSEARFWFAVFLVGVWLALGKSGGLYSFAYFVLPGTKTFHDPARFLHLASFALAVLAARGIDRLKARDGVKLALVCIAAVDLALFARTLNPTVPKSAFDAQLAKLNVALAGASRVRNESERQIWWRYFDNRTMYPDPAPLDVVSTGVPNTPMLVGVRDVGGYEPVRRKDYQELADRRRAGVTDLLRWRRDTGARRTAIRETARVEWNGAAIAVATESADRVEIALPEAHVGGTLVLRDVLAPGWRARIDGREAPIVRSAQVFRAVVVRPGARAVAFTYEPAPVRVGLFLTMFGVGAVAFLFTVGDNGANVRPLFRR